MELHKCLLVDCNNLTKNKYCSQICYHKISSQNLKGKTWEQIYGIDGAQKFREKRRQTRLGKKLNRVKPSYKKGLKYNEIYGEEKAKQILKKIHNKISQKLYWTKQEIIDGYIQLPNMRKNEWNYYRKKTKLISDSSIIRRLFGSFNNFEIESKKKFLLNFKRVFKSFGENEKQILDYVEKQNNIKLKRQYKVYIKGTKKYFLDGYDKQNNCVYEVFEPGHYSSYKNIGYDIKREIEIKNKLNCNFIILKEEEWLCKINQKEEQQCIIN